MEKEEKTEGIVLRSFDYKDHKRIITVFSQECGLISLITRKIAKNNYRFLSLTTPFSQIEVVFKRGRSELFQLIDGTVLQEHLQLRERYLFLQTAGQLAQAIIRSQMPGKSTPALYLLFRSFLKQIPTFPDLPLLLSAFYLKLLRHEGLIAIAPQCTHCLEQPARFLLNGESLCDQHTTPEAHSFSTEEWNCLLTIDQSQHFSSLSPPHFSSDLAEKISHLFHAGI